MINPIYAFGILDQSQNLFNYYASDNQPGYAVSGGSGNTYALAGWNASGFMKLTYPLGVSVSFVGDYAFYDKDKKYIKGGGDLKGGAQILIAPVNAVYMRISIRDVDYKYNGFTAYNVRRMYPTYKDDLAKDWELESNQRFYRAKFSGKISFIRDDYDYLANMTFDTEFVLLTYKSFDMGLTWALDMQSKFMKTDCQWNADDRKVTVQPDTLDQYNDVLAGLEKEYNLIELAPAIQPLQFKKRPLIQVYIPGDSVVSCFLGGMYWEQDANAVSNRNSLVNTHYFALCNLLKEINVTGNSNPSVNGLYSGRMTPGNNNIFTGNLYPDVNNGFYIRASQVYQPPFWSLITYEFVRSSDSVVMFRYQYTSPGNRPEDNFDFDAPAVSGSGATGTAHCEMATYSIYARYLLDVDKIQDLNTYAIPSDDIVENNRNYRRVIGYAINVAYISNNHTTTPTQWGIRDDGTYFQPPWTLWGQTFYPIARSTWRYASIWFAFYLGDDYLEQAGRKQYVLRDTNPLSSVISVLLKQFAPGITHEATPEYSQLLYGGTNLFSTGASGNQIGYAISPATGNAYQFAGYNATGYINIAEAYNVYFSAIAEGAFYDVDKNYISGIQYTGQPGYVYVPSNAAFVRMSVSTSNWATFTVIVRGGLFPAFTLMLSQKSNVLHGDYDRPAQKAPITLQQITNMLRDCFRAYWYIDNGKFKIEHVQYFRNGGSYAGQIVAYDLTQSTNVRNGKKWSFNTANWDFDKVDLPERYQFAWMDDVTKGFEGVPMQVVSKYVTAGKIENVNVSNFTSDVDYMILNPGALSEDGFALFAATWNTVVSRDGYIGYPLDTTQGYYVNNANGQLIANADYTTINFMQIVGGHNYQFEKINAGAWYDANQNFISGIAGTNYGTIKAPTNAAFVRVSCANTNLSGVDVRAFSLPFTKITVEGTEYFLQNGILSWMYLQPTFYVYDLPARNVLINGQSAYAYGIERKKKQTVNYPSLDDPNPMQLIKTSIGTGQIEKISINLSSRMNKLTVKHDTE